MNTKYLTTGRTALALAIASILVIGCASAPMKPAGSEQVRAKLSALQGDPELAVHAEVPIKDAETAVKQAEMIQPDLELAAHRVYIADRKVDAARAMAETRFSEEQRPSLARQSEQARLDARTREADLAKADALTARAENVQQKAVADQARSDTEAAQREAAELQRQMDILQAKPTERGMVLTLGDTLFATAKAELRSGATANLDKLGTFLSKYQERTASIEGFTDSMGGEGYNQDLSQRRADAVKQYLVGRGIDPMRLASAGRGENAPVADNGSADGRQQNRRVEVVINELPMTSGTN
jgi:outer membrane protein OmpA-like peptidoglycan-associated protein